MPINRDEEQFAQKIADGSSASEAYRVVFKHESRELASRLRHREDIASRIDELIARDQRIEHVAEQRAIAKLTVTRLDVLEELRKIAFASTRKAVRWGTRKLPAEIAADGRSHATVTAEVPETYVELIPSDDLDDDTAAAIAEVRLNRNGSVSVKFHDKQAALVSLGKHFGLFSETDQRIPDAPVTGDVTTAVDRPPRETLEQWNERRRKELGADMRGVGAAARTTNGSHNGGLLS